MSLSMEKAGLLALWEERKKEFEQCHELQMFMRDAEQIDNWMAKQEVGIDNNNVHCCYCPVSLVPHLVAGILGS